MAMESAAGRRLYGSDFCHPMLTGANVKIAGIGEKLAALAVRLGVTPLPA